MISGTQHISAADLELFNAAHIFPYAREQAWVNEYMSRWITDKAPSEEQGENKIHSVQNGLLMRVDVHKLFDTYGVSVNVDVRDQHLQETSTFNKRRLTNTSIGWV